MTRVGARGVVVGSVIAATVFLVAFVRLWPYVIDDTYISLRYAQHAAEGLGLVYNAGDPVQGFSNFLWTAFLILPFLLHLQPVPFLKVVLALVTLATAYFTMRLGRASGLTAEDGHEGGLAWVPAWLLLLTPLIHERAADGLETMPFTLLLVLAVTWSFEARGTERFPRPALALLALTLMRPDGVAFAPILMGIAAARGARPGYLARFVLLFLVPLAVFLFAGRMFYGDWLPNTFYAKGGGLRYMPWGAGNLGSFLMATGGWVWLAAAPALFVRRLRPAAWLIVGVIASRAAFQLWSGGAWMGKYRFLVPTLPFLYILLAGSVAAMARSYFVRRLALAAVAVLLLAPAWLSRGDAEADRLDYGRGLARAQGALGRDIAARTTPDAVIAMDDAGLGPFLARRRNVDMLGLNDRHVAHLRGSFSRKYDIPYVLGQQPDLIVLVSSTDRPRSFADFPLRGHAAMATDSTFRARYEWLRDYPMRLDYHLLVFRRRDSRAVPADF